MPNVNELLTDAIRYDQIFLAYCVCIAVRNGVVTTDVDEEKLYASELPFDEIQKAFENDSLQLKQNSIKLFMVKYNFDYAIYLAKHQEEVEQLHLKLFKEVSERIIEATHKKGTSIYDEHTKKTMNFYDMQNRTVSFPHFCGVMESRVRVGNNKLH